MKKVLFNIVVIILVLVITLAFFEITNWYHIGDDLTPFVLSRLITFFILFLALSLGIIYFSKNDQKLFWIILLILGILPFIIALVLGIYYAISGFAGLCFCGNFYGFKAFGESITLYSYNFYQNYILGVILIILSIIKMKKIRNSNLNIVWIKKICYYITSGEGEGVVKVIIWRENVVGENI